MPDLQVRDIHFIEDSDDEVFLARMLLDIQNVDYNLIHHTSLDAFSAAVRNLKNTEPMIIIVDLNLPGMKGDEIVKHICQYHKREKMFVGICTGSDDPADMQRAKEVGAQFYVSKPLNLECLNKICSVSEIFNIFKISPDKVGIFVSTKRNMNYEHCIH